MMRLGGLALFARMLGGCGGEASVPIAGDGNCSDGVTTTYTNPTHAHTTIDLTAAELTRAAPGAYVLLTGSHQHTFVLSAADFAALSSGSPVTKVDTEGDGHIIGLRC